jgi:enterochelin esterase-like enzyme
MPEPAPDLLTETFDFDGGRQVTVYVPPDPPEAIVFGADGSWHISRLSASLAAGQARATMIVGVHGLPDDDGRLKEYVPGFDPERFEAHEQFFVEDVGGWIQSRFAVGLEAGRTAVWGASLGGEFALAMGMRHPDIYGVVFSASPGAGFRPPAEMPGRLPRVYLVAGAQEEFFLENARRWAKALRKSGADVTMTERDGGHGGAFWGEELPLMLAWAFG